MLIVLYRSCGRLTSLKRCRRNSRLLKFDCFQKLGVKRKGVVVALNKLDLQLDHLAVGAKQDGLYDVGAYVVLSGLFAIDGDDLKVVVRRIPTDAGVVVVGGYSSLGGGWLGDTD